MEFTQSRFQDIFSRCYEAVFYIIGYFVVTLLLIYCFPEENFGIYSFLFSVVTFFFSLFTYKNGSKRLCLSDDKFVYQNEDIFTEFAWQEYQGYKISRFPPYQVIIKDTIYDNTRFSYYAFSPQQRQQIFAILDTKSQAVN